MPSVLLDQENLHRGLEQASTLVRLHEPRIPDERCGVNRNVSQARSSPRATDPSTRVALRRSDLREHPAGTERPWWRGARRDVSLAMGWREPSSSDDQLRTALVRFQVEGRSPAASERRRCLLVERSRWQRGPPTLQLRMPADARQQIDPASTSSTSSSAAGDRQDSRVSAVAAGASSSCRDGRGHRVVGRRGLAARGGLHDDDDDRWSAYRQELLASANANDEGVNRASAANRVPKPQNGEHYGSSDFLQKITGDKCSLFRCTGTSCSSLDHRKV